MNRVLRPINQFLLLIGVFVSSHVFCQKVFVTNYRSEATIVVDTVPKFRADTVIHISKFQNKNSWTFVKWKSDADIIVFFDFTGRKVFFDRKKGY